MNRMIQIIAPLCATVLSGSGVFALEMPEIVSHRGESVDRPENSMAAFRLAFERGVGGVECDVYATTDGVPVCIHDTTTKRTAGAGTNLTVTASSWDDLKDVRIGAFGSWIGTEWEGETIPKLEDYLSLLSLNDTTRCVIELKNGANDLVANVVKAIKAQPLATKDRVVFISFDHDLIKAIRTEFPDYPAWLLYSSAKTGAEFLADIATYNATGVDVKNTAAVSAEDINAVTSAGYKYAVWVCDDPSAALSLVCKGVQSIATNDGGMMLSELQDLIDEYHVMHAEIVIDGFPEGATLMDVDAYVQNGLVGHFDGIRNAGASEPYSRTAATWKNLVDGGPDAEFISETPTLCWNAQGNGFDFPGQDVYARLASPGIDLDHNGATIQLVTTLDCSEQPTGRYVYPAIFHSSVSGNLDFGMFINNYNTTGVTSDTLNLKPSPYSNNITSERPTITAWGGKYATAMLANGKQYLVEGTKFGDGKTRTGCNDVSPLQFSWGGSAYDTKNRYAKGTYHAVRIYNACLDDGDLEWNRLIDEVRYRGFITNGVIIIDSARNGAAGTEANGAYFVNGNHTFTAPASVTVGGCTYAPSGYKLETFNYTTGAWELTGEYSGASYSFTNCLAASGKRLTWNWKLIDGIKKIDADDYVQSGLVLNFDGIRNAGLDAAHDSSATTWANLGSLGSAVDATNAVLSSTYWHENSSAGCWTGRGYFFKNRDFFLLKDKVALSSAATSQIVSDYDAAAAAAFYSESGIRWPTLISAIDTMNHFMIYLYTQSGSWHHAYSYAFAKKRNDVTGWDGRYINRIFDSRNAQSDMLSISAGTSWVTGTASLTFGDEVGSHLLAIGTGANTDEANWYYHIFYGTIHAVRQYDRVLSESELKRNKEIDEARFFGRIASISEKDVVLVRSESPGGAVTLDDDGSYILRGSGAKTFASPETVTVEGRVYACSGYCLETQNAESGLWEMTNTSADREVTLSCTSGGANRRLTWKWTMTKGLRTAADYTVDDYVQCGLAENFDGLSNYGASQSRYTSATKWINLADGGVDASVKTLGEDSVSDAAVAGSWGDDGYQFGGKNYFLLDGKVQFGSQLTVQIVHNTENARPPQVASYPAFFGSSYRNRDDFSIYCAAASAANGPYFKLHNESAHNMGAVFSNNYINAIYDDKERKQVSIGNATLPQWQTSNASGALPAWSYSIGAAWNSDYYRKSRVMVGKISSVRAYNRILTDAEFEQNRKVDEIRYGGNFANYANLIVSNALPADVEGTFASAVAPGYYELAGEMKFTADAVDISSKTYLAYHTVQKKNADAWVTTAGGFGDCTVNGDDGVQRIIWTWKCPGMIMFVR